MKIKVLLIVQEGRHKQKYFDALTGYGPARFAGIHTTCIPSRFADFLLSNAQGKAMTSYPLWPLKEGFNATAVNAAGLVSITSRPYTLSKTKVILIRVPDDRGACQLLIGRANG